MTETIFMKQAFLQAVNAVGMTDPNPPVGAVLVNQKKK